MGRKDNGESETTQEINTGKQAPLAISVNQGIRLSFHYTKYYRKYISIILLSKTMDFPMGLSGTHFCFTSHLNIASLAPLLKQNYLREINARFRISNTTEHHRLSSELM